MPRGTGTRLNTKVSTSIVGNVAAMATEAESARKLDQEWCRRQLIFNLAQQERCTKTLDAMISAPNKVTSGPSITPVQSSTVTLEEGFEIVGDWLTVTRTKEETGDDACIV